MFEGLLVMFEGLGVMLSGGSGAGDSVPLCPVVFNLESSVVVVVDVEGIDSSAKASFALSSSSKSGKVVSANSSWSL